MIVTIFFTIATLALSPVVSAEPVLSLKVTYDVSLICNMDGFSGNIDWLGSLQIAKRRSFEGGSNSILATVIEVHNHTSKTMASDRLKKLHPSHYIAGEINPERPNKSWLTLTLINMDEDMNGGYVCMINYMDHPADIKQKTWTAELTVNASRQETVQRKGFSVVPGRGVSASCVAELYSLDPVSHIMIVSEDGKSSASWSKDTGYVTKSLVSPVCRPQEGTFQAHLLHTDCTAVSKYQCKVTRTSGFLSECPPESLPLEGCPPSTTFCSTSTLSVTKETKTLSTTIVTVIAVFMSLVSGVVVSVICFYLYKRGKLCFKSCQKVKASRKKTIEKGYNRENESLKRSSSSASKEQVEANDSIENKMERAEDRDLRATAETPVDPESLNVYFHYPQRVSDDDSPVGMPGALSV